MPKDHKLSPERFRSRSNTVGVTREGEVNFTSASSLHTPDDLQPERLHYRGEEQAALNDTQLSLRVDRIKQRLFQVITKATFIQTGQSCVTLAAPAVCSLHQIHREARPTPVLVTLSGTVDTTSALSTSRTLLCHTKQAQSSQWPAPTVILTGVLPGQQSWNRKAQIAPLAFRALLRATLQTSYTEHTTWHQSTNCLLSLHTSSRSAERSSNKQQ